MAVRRFTHNIVKDRYDGRRLEKHYYGGNKVAIETYHWEKDYGDDQQGGGGQSWESYWASQPEVLFFGLYSEISGGQMPNKVTGSSDYLTVAGAVGSETYQCPNTAPYISADTDYIWFKTDASQRTVTTAELIGYDLQRAPVKYLDDYPNTLQAIMILSSAVTEAKRDRMFRDMRLQPYWDNSANDYGLIKSNKPLYTQVLWTPEAVFPAAILDGGTVCWYCGDDTANITVDGSNNVSAWKDKLASGRDLLQTGADDTRPILTNGTVRFDGSNDFLKAVFTWNQPNLLYLVVRQITWTQFEQLFSGTIADTGRIQQYTASPQIRAVVANASANSVSLAVGTWGIIRVLFNGVNSKLIINNEAPITWSCGIGNMGGLVLGSSFTPSVWANVEYAEVIGRNKSEGGTDETDIYNYLVNKYAALWT